MSHCHSVTFVSRRPTTSTSYQTVQTSKQSSQLIHKPLGKTSTRPKSVLASRSAVSYILTLNRSIISDVTTKSLQQLLLNANCILIRKIESSVVNLRYCDFYSAPQCSHCKRCISYGNFVRPSVCPSIRPSHAGIVSKRRHVARFSLHCWMAKYV